ncbi:toxin-antitoxin system HicB family antitoxin [Amycolatopsis sp. cg5]|uniref:toxin-antitoxin system HicB family antitoxin n=1 Tax=Amycolatopsis sp. cg5 TaxID=3238802 RepID=UPI003525326C
MDLSPYITNLREDLAATASAGDDQTRRTAALLSAAIEPSVRLALMNALADLAAEVTASLPDHVVEVRLDGRDVRVVVTGGAASEEPPAETPREPLPSIDGGDITRITLRLVEQIKGQAEKAAQAQGVSLNTFVSQAVQGALGKSGGHQRHQDKGKRSDSRLHGWVEG